MRTHKYSLNIQKKSFDFPLIGIIVFMLVFGLIMVYDSSVVQALKDFGYGYYYIKQQLIWVVLGVIIAIFFANFDFHRFKKLALPMLIISLLLLVGVFIPGLGVSGGGAHRWLDLGFFTVQPAEIIKLTGAIFLATVFEKKANLKILIVLLLLVSFITAVLQKDLGSTIVFALMSV